MKESDAASYLLRSGLLETASVVGGDLRIVDASRRNTNFRVLDPAGESYLVKKGVASEGVTTSSREAAIYRFLWSAPRAVEFRAFLPRLFAVDPDEDLLVIELFPDADDLRQHHRRRSTCSTRIAAAVGRGLALLHLLAIPDDLLRGHNVTAFEPPGFYLHQPGLHVLHELSAACLELLQVVQDFPEVGEALEALRREWRGHAFIHNDMRSDNILVLPITSRGSRVKLIDWETAGIGDPAWDLGALFGDYLALWLCSIPVNSGATPDAYVGLAQYPLARIQPAIGACWQAYIDTAGLDAAAGDELLAKVAQFAGVKLMQNSLEHLDRAPSCSTTAVSLLQTGLNIVARPRDAVQVLFGLLMASHTN